MRRPVPRPAIGTAAILGVAAAWSQLFGGPAEPRPVDAASCVAEAEPDDQPDTAVSVSGASCLSGSLPDGDGQDTWVWTLGDDDARHTWTITLTGVPGTKTEVQMSVITSPPGVTPIVWGGQQLLVLDAGPDPGSSTRSDVLVPAGRYVLGVGRTASVSGSPLGSFDYGITLAPGDSAPSDSR